MGNKHVTFRIQNFFSSSSLLNLKPRVEIPAQRKWWDLLHTITLLHNLQEQIKGLNHSISVESNVHIVFPPNYYIEMDPINSSLHTYINV